jgi:hypothetical protein
MPDGQRHYYQLFPRTRHPFWKLIPVMGNFHPPTHRVPDEVLSLIFGPTIPVTRTTKWEKFHISVLLPSQPGKGEKAIDSPFNLPVMRLVSPEDSDQP